MSKSTLAVGLLFVTSVSGCSSGLNGTYTNTGGMVMLELASGGKATMSMGGDIKTCTYTADEKSVVLNCGRNDQMSLRVNSDGSLTAPGFVGVMKKSK
jgi:hypothetical protein